MKERKTIWITQDTLNIMEERRVNKGNQLENRKVQNIIRKRIGTAKENELIRKCE